MATYFVKTSAATIFATPSDSLDGLCPAGFALTGATFTTSTKNLNKTGGFTGYTWQSGDILYIAGGTGVTTGLYEIASKTDNDNIVLVEDIGGTDPSDVSSGTGPWTTVGKANTTATTAGDIVRICADAAYAEGNHTITAAGSEDTGLITWTGANSRGVVDGTKASLTSTGNRVLYLSSSHYRNFSYLDCSGNVAWQTVYVQANGVEFYKCKFTGATGASHAFDVVACPDVHDEVLFIGCEFTGGNVTGTTAHGIESDGPVTCIGCTFHSCAGHGVSVVGNGSTTLINCLIHDNNGDGVNVGSSGDSLQVISCTIEGNAGDGISITTLNASYDAIIVNSIIANNGAVGIVRPANANFASRGVNNLFYTNSSGDVSSTLAEEELDSISGDPLFTTAGSDYSLQTSSPAKAAGFPGAITNGTGYLDVGAMQRQEPAGGVNIIRRTQDALIGR